MSSFRMYTTMVNERLKTNVISFCKPFIAFGHESDMQSEAANNADKLIFNCTALIKNMIRISRFSCRDKYVCDTRSFYDDLQHEHRLVTFHATDDTNKCGT